MYIYRLTRPTGGWDENRGFVVVAESPRGARKIAAQRVSGDEPHEIWLDPKQTKCEQVGGYTTGAFRKPQIVLTDFLAG